MKAIAVTASCSMLFLTLFSCRQNERPELIGHWQGVEILEEGRPLKVESREIQFEFQPGGSYYFQSTLNYREAGRYRIAQRQFLLTTDTLQPGTAEKAVEIIRLTPDSLSLRMLDEGKERLLKLVKVP